MAKHDIAGKYIGMTARERIGYIYKNYKDLDYLKESYRDYAVETISFLKQQENSCERNIVPEKKRWMNLRFDLMASAVFTVGVVSIYNEKRFINLNLRKQTRRKEYVCVQC